MADCKPTYQTLRLENAMRRSFAIILLIVIAAITARSESFWVKKDWREWSKGDCNKMLQDSPWAKKWSKSVVILGAASAGRSGAAREGAGGENHPEVDYAIMIQSAPPIREAEARRMQIEQKYDRMDEQHKKDLEARAEQLLAPTFDDFILVHVEYSSNVQTFERQLARHFQGIPEGSIPLGIYMITQSGDHIGPSKWVSPRTGEDEFEMYIPRTVKGEPVIKPTDKKFSIQFRAPAVGSQAVGNPGNVRNTNVATMGNELVLVEFKLDAMVWNGKVTY